MTVTDEITDLERGEVPSEEGTYRTSSGTTYRVRLEPDDFEAGWTDDFYGRIGADRTDYYTGRAHRPEGFTGNAERLWYGNYGPWWWEPPTDVKRTDPNFKTFRESVREILAFGFSCLIVEVLEGADFFGRPIVVNAASVGGIEPFDRDLAPLIADLLGEMEVDYQ